MAYHLHLTNDQESLLRDHHSLLVAKDLFADPVWVVVQNANLADWLKLRLAETRGIVMDPVFLFPDQALRELIDSYLQDDSPSQPRLLYADDLALCAYIAIRKAIASDTRESAEKFRLLSRYIQGEDKNHPESLQVERSYEMASLIGDLFYHYGQNSPDLVEAWDRDESLLSDEPEAVVEVEAWQRALWRRIYDPDRGRIHPYRFMSAPFVVKENRSLPRICIVGTAFLTRCQLDFFLKLSREVGGEIHHFMITPVDLTRPEETLTSTARHWGELLLRHHRYLKKQQDIHWQVTYSPRKRETLLAKVREEIFSPSASSPSENINLDGSLHLAACPGRQREMEILRDAVIELLQKDKALNLSDIGVFAPDIEVYAEEVEAVFSSSRESPIIPYNVADLHRHRGSPYLEGFEGLLEMVDGLFSVREVFALLGNPCLQAKFAFTRADLEILREEVKKLHIRWGMDGHHRMALGKGKSLHNTWEAGFERFFLGQAFGGESGDDLLSINSKTCLPHPMLDREMSEAFGDFIHLIRSLYGDLTPLLRLKLPLSAWADISRCLADTYLGEREGETKDRRDRNQLDQILSQIRELGKLFPKERLDFSVFRMILIEQVEKKGGSRGQYLSGLTFSSLRPMRAIPFQAIFLIGMDEGVFPHRERSVSFDLSPLLSRRPESLLGERFAAEKLSFLECLASAKKVFHLFYTGRDNVDNQWLEPSALIQDLHFFLDGHFSGSGESSLSQALTARHPLHGFDALYFTAPSEESCPGLRSYRQDRYREARATQADPLARELDWGEPPEKGGEIPWEKLLTLFKHPAKVYCHQTLGWYVHGEEEEEENESTEIDYWDKTAFYSDVVSEPLNAEGFVLREKLRGKITADLLSVMEIKEIKKASQSLNKQMEALGASHSLKPLPRIILQRASGRGGRNETLLPCYPLQLENRSILSLSGRLDPVYEGQQIMSFSYRSNMRETINFLRPYLEALLLTAHPASPFRETDWILMVYGMSKGEAVSNQKTISLHRSEAQEILEAWGQAYSENLSHPRPFFYPAMEASLQKKEKEEIIDRASRARNSYEEKIAEDPYIRKVFPKTPDFEDEALYSFAEKILHPLLKQAP